MSDPVQALDDICAREPIQSSGAIQPHGWLLSCLLPDWTVRHASANIAALLDVEAADLVGQSLRDHLSDEVLDAVAEVVGFSDSGTAPQRAAVANIGPMAQLCDVGVHVQQGMVHIEIEAQPNRIRERTPTVVAQTMISRLASAIDEDDFHGRIAQQVRLLTGYDRVMVYRFRHDDAGDVIAEARAEDMDPYLGLRYPASDIPQQARALYLRNRLRVIPDAAYRPVPIVPPETASGLPLDLSQHALRSVSPVHLEYMRNMGVAASMSISIVSGGRLWGLIACHHRAPRAVAPGIRAAADLFGMFVSMRVSAREQEAASRAEMASREARAALAARMDDAGDWVGVLLQAFDLLRLAVPCDGVAIWAEEQWTGTGRVPAAAEAGGVMAWVESQDQTAMVATHQRADWSGQAPHDGLAGVLALPLGAGGDWLLLFRSQQVEDVRWAGNPDKAVHTSDDGLRISPRHSFETWRQTVHGLALPWSDGDRRAADALRMLVNGHRRRGLERHPTAADAEGTRRRQGLRKQKARLDQLSGLLDGMVHLGDAEATRLGERIASLEHELRQLMHQRVSLEG